MIAAMLAVFYVDDRLDRLDISGTALQTVFAGRTYLPSGLLMLAVFLVLIAVGSRELVAIFRAKQIEADRFMVAAAGMCGCVVMYAMPYTLNSQQTLAGITTAVCVLFLMTLVNYASKRRTEGAVAAVGVTMFSLIYLGLLPGFFIIIRRWHSAWVILGILLITKSCDIGAYFTGRAIGRHKLIPWLSPGKTWEGVIGGLTLSAIVALLLGSVAAAMGVTGHYDYGGVVRGEWLVVRYPWWLLLLAGVLMGLVGQFGDLAASLFKRDAGIKDSGTSIPGFGGILDVVDSPLAVAPLAYWLLLLGRYLSDAQPM